MSNYDVVSIGSAILDIFMKSDKFKVVSSGDIPGGIAMCEVYGGKMEVAQVEIISGGGATNTAVSFAKKDLKSAIVSEMGNDPQALLIHRDLEEAQVETKYLVQEPGETTAVSVVLIAEDGGRSIMVYRGASAMLTRRDLPLDELETRWVHISSLGGNLELLTTLLRWAKHKGVRVSLNPGMKEIEQRAKLLPLLDMVEILFLNKEEAGALWGDGGVRVSARVVVITDGERGGEVREGAETYSYAGDKVKKVVDSTGAGDAFASGMVAGVLYGKTYRQAVAWGIANASSVLRHVGAKAGLLTLAQINR